jgi:hypothetical protein
MIAARRLGMPSTSIATYAQVLKQMQYTIKTNFGISELYIQSTVEHFLFRTGQGSGASPAVWFSQRNSFGSFKDNLLTQLKSSESNVPTMHLLITHRMV